MGKGSPWNLQKVREDAYAIQQRGASTPQEINWLCNWVRVLIAEYHNQQFATRSAYEECITIAKDIEEQERQLAQSGGYIMWQSIAAADCANLIEQHIRERVTELDAQLHKRGSYLLGRDPASPALKPSRVEKEIP